MGTMEEEGGGKGDMARKKSQSLFPKSHDVYGYIAVAVVFIALFVILSGISTMG